MASAADLRAYLFSTKPTAQTRNHIRQALIGFGAFAVDMGWAQSNNAAGLPRLPEVAPPPKALDVKQARRIAGVAGALPLADRTLVLIFLYGGLRKSEARRLQWTQVSDDGLWLRFAGKGARVREVPLHEQARGALVALRLAATDPRWVFPSPRRRDAPVSETYVRELLYTVGDMAGIPHLHPHQLRHTAATRLLERGADIRTVQEYLGHASPRTTAIYTRVRPARVLEATGRLDFDGADVQEPAEAPENASQQYGEAQEARFGLSLVPGTGETASTF